MKNNKMKTVIYASIFMLTGCAQTVPAPVTSGYQRGNVVYGPAGQPAENKGFSLTREVSARAAGEPAYAAAADSGGAPGSLKEEELQRISPAAGPESGGQNPGGAGAAAPAANRSLVADWTEKPVQSQGVVTHVVQPGETMYRLARRYNTTPAEILKQNQLDSTAQLATGQQLRIASGSRLARAEAPQTRAEMAQNPANPPVLAASGDARVSPVVAQTRDNARIDNARVLPPPSLVQNTPMATSQPMEPNGAETAEAKVASAKMESIEPAAGPAAAPTPAAAKVTTHKVLPGETVYRIAHQYGASVLDVMSANQFSQPQDLKAGMMVRVPVGEVAAGAGAKVVSREEDESVASAPVPAKTAVDEVKAAFNKGKIDPMAARARGLAWPVHGQVISRFGSQGGGVAHAGINIAVPPNTPVLATDNGTVLYAGSGLKTYGNLVLVRHASGMVSAYAHNNQLLVAKGEVVKKGQVLALSGATGNVDKPQVHFELRRAAQPIDPMTLLAAQ